jgi:hypothetical protein
MYAKFAAFLLSSFGLIILPDPRNECRVRISDFLRFC